MLAANQSGDFGANPTNLGSLLSEVGASFGRPLGTSRSKPKRNELWVFLIWPIFGLQTDIVSHFWVQVGQLSLDLLPYG